MPVKQKKGLLGRLRGNPTAPPTGDIMSMQAQGMPKGQITDDLANKGFGQQQISEGINQADLKQGVDAPGIPAPPTTTGAEQAPPEEPFDLAELERMAPEPAQQQEPLAQQMEQPQYNQQPMAPQYPSTPQPIQSREITEQIEELAESIISEKWEEMTSGIGDISLWKEQIETEITSIKQEIIRFEKRFDLLQASLLGKVAEYGQNISSISTEMKALEKVFSKILQPLTTNVKELSKITTQLKTIKK